MKFHCTDMGAAILNSWVRCVLKPLAEGLTWGGKFDLNCFALLGGSVYALVKPRRAADSGEKQLDAKTLARFIRVKFAYRTELPPYKPALPPYVEHLVKLLEAMPRGPLTNSCRIQLEAHCAGMTLKGQMILVGMLKGHVDSITDPLPFLTAVDAAEVKPGWFNEILTVPLLRKIAFYERPADLNNLFKKPPYYNTNKGAFNYVRNYDTHIGEHCRKNKITFDDGASLVIPDTFGDFLAELMTALLEAPGLSDDIAEIAKSCLPSPIFVEAGLLVLMEEGLLPCNKLNQGIPLPVLQPTSTTRTETLEPKLDSNVIEAQETAISSQESKEMVTLNARKTHINIVVIGHANSGKSTMTGNLLFKLGEIDKLVMDGIEREAIDMNMQPSKYAWVLNKLKAERQKAITIDITAMKFETPKYCCTIIDAPGHREFIKNMITGTSQADCAVLIIDSMIGSFEAGMSIDGQTREHALLAFTLGVKQMICCCNKACHNEIVTEVSAYLKKVGFKPETIPFIPTSGWDGDNLIDRSPNTNWYTGPTLFEAFDQIMEPKRLSDQPLRLPLRGAYHIGGVGTVAAGCVAMGTVTSDMLVEIGPTCMRRMVTSVEMEAGKKPLLEALPGDNITLTFDAAAVATTDLLPGYVVSDPKHPAMEADSFTSHVIIMNQPGKISNGYTPVIQCHTARVSVKFDELLSKIDRSGNEIERKPRFLQTKDAALVRMIPTKPMIVEAVNECSALGRFVAHDTTQAVAVGVIKAVNRKVRRPVETEKKKHLSS